MIGHHSVAGGWLLAMLIVSSGAAAQTDDVAGAAAASEPMPAAWQAVPVGSIIAFMPRPGSDYRDISGLKRWLDRQGWALCDGTLGTPDLRNRMLLGTTEIVTTGQRLGNWEHTHQVRGETEMPVRRNRNTPTGNLQLKQIPDDQHRHRVDLTSAKAEHLPPSLRVMFIMRVR